MNTTLIHKLTLGYLIFGAFNFAQFVDANVVLDTDRLRKSTNNELDNFETTVENYLLTTEFAPDAMDIEFVIEMQFYLEEIIDKGNETVFSAQVLTHNGLDQQYFTKGVEFTYFPGKNLFYNIQFESLRSILDYYAFLIIAGDLDTYDVLGGEAYLKKTEEITIDGKSSSFKRGWDERRKKSRNLRKNFGLRNAKLHFYLAMDMYQIPESKPADIQAKLSDFYNSIMEVDAEIGKDKDTQVFLKAHRKKIGIMMGQLKMYNELKGIIEYDPDSADLLSKFLPKKEASD